VCPFALHAEKTEEIDEHQPSDIYLIVWQLSMYICLLCWHRVI
jgi:hypothetical protein